MYRVIGLTGLVSLLLILTVVINPVINIKNKKIKISFWAAPVFGAVVILLTGMLPVKTAVNELCGSGSINPLKILTLFISMTVLSIFLDEAGFFSYLSTLSLRFASKSQVKLFVLLFLLVSVLTVFTSNDIIILTFTPFICYFSKKAHIDPMPYLFGEFVAANTFSMVFIIGNPTNIYLATAAGIGFFDYLKVMLLPSLFAGITALLVLLLVFKKPLSKEMEITYENAEIKDKGLVIIGLIHLILCTIMLVISSYLGFEMWYIALGFAISLFKCTAIYSLIKHKSLDIIKKTLLRAPWELVPFIISMFIIVLALERFDVTKDICMLLGNSNTIINYGIVSFFSSNILNNIPMSVAMSSVTRFTYDTEFLKATYACIIGSNIGAYLTPLGALAGIMWEGILEKAGIDFSFMKYVKYGIKISVPVMAAALLGLSVYFVIA